MTQPTSFRTISEQGWSSGQLVGLIPRSRRFESYPLRLFRWNRCCHDLRRGPRIGVAWVSRACSGSITYCPYSEPDEVERSSGLSHFHHRRAEYRSSEGRATRHLAPGRRRDRRDRRRCPAHQGLSRSRSLSREERMAASGAWPNLLRGGHPVFRLTALAAIAIPLLLRLGRRPELNPILCFHDCRRPAVRCMVNVIFAVADHPRRDGDVLAVSPIPRVDRIRLGPKPEMSLLGTDLRPDQDHVARGVLPVLPSVAFLNHLPTQRPPIQQEHVSHGAFVAVAVHLADRHLLDERQLRGGLLCA